MVYRKIHSFGRRTGQVAVSGAVTTDAQEMNRVAGFTLIEILIVLALIGTLSMIIVPRLLGYTQRNRDLQAIVDITRMSVDIDQYVMDYNTPPDSLADVGYDTLRDPWGNPYQYLKIFDSTDPGMEGHRRKDHSLVPVNSDYDLYSMGADGDSQPAFTSTASRDDLVRASNGGFIGPVSEF
jgi:general secretion pathway protein G